MNDMGEQNQSGSSKKLMMIGGAVGAFVVVGGVVLYALIGNVGKPSSSSSTSSPAPWPRVATKEEITQSLSDLDSSLKQSATDQAATKAALKDSENQVKVGK
jgi:hypothetical protein